ncbi:MAG: proton-conducting transporter transmembrane domain-containing protein [Oceanococcus sp.]
MNNLVLPVLIPLLAAPLLVLIGGRQRAWLLALASIAAAVLATLYSYVLGDGQTALGGWQPPVGINYSLDAANRPIMLLVMSAGLVSLFMASPKQLSWLEPPRLAIFYALFCLCLCGLAGITATADAFNVFVFLEISSLSTYALVATGQNRAALRAAFQYLVLGTLGGSFVLLGVGLLYMATGSLNMADIAARLADSPLPSAILVGGVFLLLGFALKSALFPLHQWLPGVYQHSPAPVATLLAASGTKVSIYALTRFGFSVLGVSWLAAHHVDKLLLILASGAMLFGSLAAIQQTRLKALLAWSSVAQIGYIVLAISMLNQAGLAAAWLFILIHAVIKGSLFIAAANLVDDRLSQLVGLGKRDPVLASCLSIAALSLLGVPLTAGFVGKWVLIQAVWQSGVVFGVVVIAASSLLAVIYVARIVLPLWQTPEENQDIVAPTRAWNVRSMTLLGSSACIFIGLWPAPLLHACQQAAKALLP